MTQARFQEHALLFFFYSNNPRQLATAT